MILFFDKKKKNYIANSNNRDYYTTMKCINVANLNIFSLIILKTTNILLKWNLQNNLDDYVAFDVNEFDYNNDDLILNWLHHFIRFN